MVYSNRSDVFHATRFVLAAGAAIFAATTAMPGPTFAASQDYRFELVQVASAGPGRSDVTVRLVRAADGKPVADADISANAAIATSIMQAGYRQFRIETATPGPQTLQISAKVPGATRIERTFNSSVKFWQVRKVRSKDQLVSGAVSFDAR
ncbi:MAG: hypothetical protein HYX38_05310 [Rhodospirillales bacterium]|nr:hypothetical protein [Rhodospirillales bacterium]